MKRIVLIFLFFSVIFIFFKNNVFAEEMKMWRGEFIVFDLNKIEKVLYREGGVDGELEELSDYRKVRHIRLARAMNYIVKDISQTLEFKEKNIKELNPIIGSHPSKTRLIGYSVVSVIFFFYITEIIPQTPGDIAALSLIDSVYFTEKIISQQNEEIISGRIRSKVSLPFGIMITFRF